MSQDVKGKAKAINLVDEDDEVQIVDPEDDDFMEIRPIYKLNKDLDNWLEGFVTDGECMRLYSRVCWIGALLIVPIAPSVKKRWEAHFSPLTRSQATSSAARLASR